MTTNEKALLLHEEWNGKTKTARFIACSGDYVDKLLENDQCEIPCEVLRCGYCKVGVYAEHKTTTQHKFFVTESIKDGDGCVCEPTPDVYEQLTGKLDDIQAQMPVEVEEQVTEYFTEHKEELKGDNGQDGENGKDGKDGVDGHNPIREVDYWTTEDQNKIVSDVLTSEKVSQLEKTASTAVSIAKGANQTVSFTDYAAMINKLNTLSKDTYNVGQNIYIKTTGVPDVWVYEIHNEAIAYSYTDDTTIANIFKNNGTIIVGHYELSMLETDKADLTEYEKTDDVNEKINDLKENAALTYMSINAITLTENPTNGAFTLTINKG